MNAQAITLVGGLALSQLARRINMDTPERVWALRVLYLSVHALVFGMYLYIARKVRTATRRRDAVLCCALARIVRAR